MNFIRWLSVILFYTDPAPFEPEPYEDGPKVLIISANLGEGHNIVARILQQHLANLGVKADIIHLDHKWYMKQVLLYNYMIRNRFGRIFHRMLVNDFPETLPHFMSKLPNYEIESLVKNKGYNSVINLAPFGSVLMNQMNFSVPRFTVPTDMKELLPGMWMHCTKSTYLLGSNELIKQFKEWACKNNLKPRMKSRFKNQKPGSIHGINIKNMIIKPEYFIPNNKSHAEIKSSLTLDLSKRTVLVCFGGYGDDIMIKIAEWVEEGEYEYVFVCGKNAELKEKIDSYVAENNIKHIKVLGYVNNMPDYLMVSETLIGKVGPGVYTECKLYKTNMIFSDHYEDILDQERFNAEEAKKLKVAIGISEWSKQNLLQAIHKIKNQPEYKNSFTEIKIYNSGLKSAHIISKAAKNHFNKNKNKISVSDLHSIFGSQKNHSEYVEPLKIDFLDNVNSLVVINNLCSDHSLIRSKGSI